MSEKTLAKKMTPEEQLIRRKQSQTKYRLKNPDKFVNACRNYRKRVKEEDPDKYREMLEKKKQYYRDIQRPRLIALGKLKADPEEKN